jgi:NDP-sugar pyrophosphorylase family protein
VKAIVLCAGMGTRLGALTQATPKPLLPLGGRPLLEFIIRHLARQGFREIGINLHFHPEMIQDCLGDGSRWGVAIEYSFESELLGTAGALRRFEPFLRGSERFLVQYGDILTNQDFNILWEAHKRQDAAATLLLHERRNSNSVVALEPDGRITGFWERPDEATRRQLTSNWVNSGVCVLGADVLRRIPADGPSDLPRDVFTKMVGASRLFGVPLTGYRCAIDSLERYEQARDAVGKGLFSDGS